MYLKNLNVSIKTRVSSKLYDKLVSLSVIRDISVSELVRDILSQYFLWEDKSYEYSETNIND